MEHHENNGHGNSHDDSQTEGNRQYYPKGWWVPLVGLVTIALGFTLIGGFVLRASGTDKWGKSEQCEACENGKCDKGKCTDDKKCDGKCDKDKDGNAMMMNNAGGSKDSMMAKSDDGKKDSATAKADDGKAAPMMENANPDAAKKPADAKPTHKHHK